MELKKFYMNKTQSLSSPMILRSLDMDKDLFQLQMNYEKLVGPQVSYIGIIELLMYLTCHTRPNITFGVNLLEIYNYSPSRNQWNEIKHVFRYLLGTPYVRIYYSRTQKAKLVDYTNASCLSHLHDGRSQTNYLFTCGGTIIS